ncbi:MAG: hypothetical protein K5872_19795 [Rhizobiaceae bacterium]|nr:hypothetical protein [Rhizobiaceae bacterium]
MKTVKAPAFLHEVFGERPTMAEMAITLAFGISATAALVMLHPEAVADLPLWRSGLALLLIFDIFAGCAANFTWSTNQFYSARPAARWIFIAIHFHLPVAAVLLGEGVAGSLSVWGYTVVGAAIVNLLKERRAQPFAGGVLLAVGFVAIPLALQLPVYLIVVAQLFMLKVLYGFAVDHFQPGLDG